MTSYLIDINVWLALTWDKHAQHAAAARWYSSIDDAALLFCRFTMLGFLRLLTNRQVMGDSTATLSGALEIYDRWRQDPRVELAVELRAAAACIVTFDAGLAATAQFRDVPVTLIEPIGRL